MPLAPQSRLTDARFDLSIIPPQYLITFVLLANNKFVMRFHLMNPKKTSLGCFLLIGLPITLVASPAWAEWPGFLGPDGNPFVAEDFLPERFAVETEETASLNIAWKTSLPGRSVCGPIITSGRVVTTSSSAMEERWLHICAVDADSGQMLWHRSIQSTGRPYCHPTSANAAPTPCTDGKRIYSLFSSNDLVCYDLDGNLVWYRSLVDTHPLLGNDVGMSSSPVVVDGVLVVSVESQGDSLAAGFDAETGEALWEIPRARKANWSSPRVAVGTDGRSVVVLQNSENVLGVQPRSGRVAWQLDERCSSIVSPVCFGGVLYLPSDGLKAFRLENAFDSPKFLWKAARMNPASSSLVAVDGLGLFSLNRSVLACGDFSGQMKWQLRLPDAGQFWATPLVAGERMAAFASNGKCFLIDLLNDGGRIVSECDLGSEVLGSPAGDRHALYVRSVDALWKIQNQAEQP